MECVICGLAPADLPDGVEAEDVFERAPDGATYCQSCIGIEGGEG
jgi:hypothetical protein